MWWNVKVPLIAFRSVAASPKNYILTYLLYECHFEVPGSFPTLRARHFYQSLDSFYKDFLEIAYKLT